MCLKPTIAPQGDFIESSDRQPTYSQRAPQNQRGQTMMEYIILVAILAIASIPVAKVLGNVFRSKVMSAADAMVTGKEQNRTYNKRAQQYIRNAEDKVERDMSNFAETEED